MNENVVLSLNEMRKREPNEKKVNEEIKIGELITSRVLRVKKSQILGVICNVEVLKREITKKVRYR